MAVFITLTPNLDLAFDSRPLRQLCESHAKAKRELGEEVAKKLKARLADFQAAATVKDIPAGKPIELDGDKVGQMAVELTDGFRLIFCANHNRIPILQKDKVDWSQVTRIKIMNIEHES